MRKALSLVLVTFLLSASALPTLSQKSRTLGAKKLAIPVESTRFASIAAYTNGHVVWLTWQMQAEIGNIGFDVYRVGKNGPELLTSEKMVSGAATRAREVPAYGETYDFFDRSGTGNSSYYVESLSLKGDRIVSQQIFAQYASNLEAVTGLSASDIALRTTVQPAVLENTVLTFTKEIFREIEQNRQVADSATHRMVISQPGVRIGVKREGLHRVSRAQLEAAGFDVSGDSHLWQLYVEGVEQAMIVGDNAAYIEFYGKGNDTRETDIRMYYLINGTTQGKRIENRVAHRGTSTVVTPSYLQTFVKKERTSYVEDIFNGDAENYFGRGIGTNPNASPMTFNLSGVDFASSTSTMQLLFQGYTGGDHVVEVILNGELLEPTQGTDANQFTGSYSFPTSFLREGSNSIKFRTLASAGDFVYFDTMSIGFARKFIADQNKVWFYTQNYRVAKLDGFTSLNVRVFDMTMDGSPVLMTNLSFQQNGSTFGTEIPALRGRSFYAVEDAAILSADSVTPNNPELLGLPTNAANLVIISYKDFMPQAETWAEYRRAQGITVKVIEVTELFDEFNYGALSANSIKDFLEYAYTNWATPPQYVLLIGDGSWDSRNYENVGFFNFIPAKMVATGYLETASDDALADFNNDGLAEMAIGRVSGRTVANVQTVFTKVVNWEGSLTNPLGRGALFAYDHSTDFNFEAMSHALRDQLPAATPATFVYRGEANANQNLLDAMNAGKYIINFSGHGTAGSWGGNPLFFNVFSVPLQADHNPSIYTMLTCLNGFFHWLYNPSIAEVLLQAPNKGAVVAWASSSLTTPDIQQEMATRFYLKIGEGTIPRMGDLVRDAKTALLPPNDSPDVRLSWVLLGDPMLKVR